MINTSSSTNRTKKEGALVTHPMAKKRKKLRSQKKLSIFRKRTLKPLLIVFYQEMSREKVLGK